MTHPWRIFITMLCATTFARHNPLDTKDQHDLDALAISLHLQNPYEDIKREARNQFLSTAQRYGYEVDSKDLIRRLEVAVEELAFGSMQYAVNNDPAHPKVYWTMAPPRTRDLVELPVPGGRYGFDNPDCIYRTVPVSDSYNYIIHGKRTGVGASDVTFSLQSSLTSNTISIVTGKDLVVDHDGSFTITVNPSTSPSPNHMQSTPAAKLLLIRHNIGDWLLENPDELEVELVGQSFTGDRTNDTIIAQAREYLRKTIPPLNFVLGNLTLSKPVNSMASPSQSSGMGLATQALVLSHYNLSKTSALIVTVEAEPSTYWTLNIYSLWIASDDPRDRLISLNNRQAAVNKNGSYTFVLSGIDPGVFNWLNTLEEGVGTIVARFQGIPLGGDAVGHIRVWTQLCDFDDLHSVLPYDTTYVTPQHRANQMMVRARGFDRIHSLYRPCSAYPYPWWQMALPMEWLGLNPPCPSV
ncbi:hypothetical protein F5Y00DRAFT_235041 [Daldinia vernicosa]|uniref:uncharacterized protein n=1 Tax=Daldinia vernicosa TaxID=114800 RepID=UPI00200812F2|nr:uncharacterized protein F5Y00DRAFT_235041 [Daldinia vernicosa]KAI0849537.1 hypothetical protein F5Y00DRAFT_235041 [Daldinia vernicosa]